MDESNNNWRFCAVGNIKREHLGEDNTVFYGTKAFKGGTKVYIYDNSFGLHEGFITVLGLNRFGKYAVERVPIKLIENVRPQQIYKPRILSIMEYLECMDGFIWRGRTSEDKKAIEEFAEYQSINC